MPYNEFEPQMEQYFEIAKRKMRLGDVLSAEANFNMARAIAAKNNLTNWILLIDSYLRLLKSNHPV